MQKPNLTKICRNVKTATVKHSPEILTGVGIAGMIMTTVMAVRATPKAIQLLDEEKRRQQADKLEPMDVVKTAWKCYIPAAVTGTVSVACLIGASSVNARRNAALTAAYTISESTLRDYQKKVVEEPHISNLKGEHIMENNEIMNNNEEVIETTTEEIVKAASNGGMKKATTIGLAMIAGALSRQCQIGGHYGP